MPGIIMDEIVREDGSNDANSSQIKENLSTPKSPRASSPSQLSAPIGALEIRGGNFGEPSIEQLYHNVCEMESSSEDSGRPSFGSDGEESRIDSELCHLVGGEMEAVKAIEDEEERASPSGNMVKTESPAESLNSSKKSKNPSKAQLESSPAVNSSPNDNSVKKTPSRFGRLKKQANGGEDPSEAGLGLDNPDLGPFLLKRSRDLIASDNIRRALKYARRALKSFEKCSDGKPNLNLVRCLHVLAAINCNLGQYGEAVPLLLRSLEIPVLEEGPEHALAKFSGYMQLGDTYAMLGQLESSIKCYNEGLQVQKQTLGDTDPRVGETCRYLAEAYVQALQFDEARRLCQMALDIHKESGEPASLEETADRRLMGLICDTKGDHEEALEHLVLASMAMVANGQESEVASVDSSIGDIYLSLARYDEAVFAYQKALTVFKTSKGENHPAVASVFVRLADLYNKIGKIRESKSYCENALRIYQKPIPGTSPEEIATGLTDISAIYESMNEHEQALKLLQKALKSYNNSAGHQSTIAGIEAQMGVLYYITGNYGESYVSFKSAISKLRACGEKKSAFFGVALNQMGLACVQRYAINEAAELFEEARSILEQEYGPYHPDTLGVYSNLAGTYDAMGRLDEAIEMLEYVVGMREEKLGTANPDVADEKRRLAELLKEAGRARSRKARSLENLLETNHPPTITATAAATTNTNAIVA
ncbi:Nephrocystin-3 [Ananas comosus]|uniref:Nephrocystin-3 n=1 Tax=Ananas comosus TaxID=4615 RepID=A0A199UXJ9_ANACO|nr:Nephrocystin-3 [Ananas comosus]